MKTNKNTRGGFQRRYPRGGTLAAARLAARAALAPVLAAGCLSFSSGKTVSRASYIPGLYEGRGRGERGPVTVQVLVDESRILEIAILENAEDPFIGLPAMESVAGTVVEENSTAVDAVSGATASSLGFLAAVDAALEKARSGP